MCCHSSSAAELDLQKGTSWWFRYYEYDGGAGAGTVTGTGTEGKEQTVIPQTYPYYCCSLILPVPRLRWCWGVRWRSMVLGTNVSRLANTYVLHPPLTEPLGRCSA